MIIFFEKIKNKYPKLFNKKNYPPSNIFINDLLKDEKYFIGCYSKDNIPLIENNESIIINTQNSFSKKVRHWIALTRNDKNIYIFDSFGVSYIPQEINSVYNKFKIVTNIYRIQNISSNRCGMFCILFVLYKINSKIKFIQFLTKFNKNYFLKNDII